MATITDVANEAGVSISTVSRVLNKSLLVTDEKREKVMRAVETVGYEIPRAKIVKSMKNKGILVISTISIRSMFSGLEKAAEELGYMLLYKFVDDSQDAYDQCADVLKLFGNDILCGVILFNVLSKSETLNTIFGDLPVVQVGEYCELNPTYAVFSDDELASYELVSLLIGKGKKRIGFVTLGQNFHFCLDRLQGYQRALREHGLEALPEYIYRADYSFEGGQDAAAHFMTLAQRPDAICCISDSIAVTCMKELIRNGIRVPQDVAVAGFDGVNIAEVSSPEITTVVQSFLEIGEEAINTMDMILQGKLAKGRRVIIPHSIIEREST